MFGHNLKHHLDSLLSAPKNHDSQSYRKGSEGEMLYYIQHCRNECHVVVTSVTPGREIAMQGHMPGCQTGSIWMLEPGFCSQVSCSQDIHTKPSYWSLCPESHRLPAPLEETVSASRGLGISENLKNALGYTSCPLSYPQ